MRGFSNPSPLLKALWQAQAGKCFHCDGPMIFRRRSNAEIGLYATREHIYPISTYEASGLHNNIVLAHARCNGARGAPAVPSPMEVVKGKEIYAKLGLEAFVYGAQDNKKSVAIIGYLERGGATPEDKALYIKSQGAPPASKLADLWPAREPDAGDLARSQYIEAWEKTRA